MYQSNYTNFSPKKVQWGPGNILKKKVCYVGKWNFSVSWLRKKHEI